MTAFAQTLRRYTSLNHLAQAARAVLQNTSQINQMLSDLNRVDFANVQVSTDILFTVTATVPQIYEKQCLKNCVGHGNTFMCNFHPHAIIQSVQAQWKISGKTIISRYIENAIWQMWSIPFWFLHHDIILKRTVITHFMRSYGHAIMWINQKRKQHISNTMQDMYISEQCLCLAVAKDWSIVK